MPSSLILAVCGWIFVVSYKSFACDEWVELMIRCWEFSSEEAGLFGFRADIGED